MKAKIFLLLLFSLLSYAYRFCLARQTSPSDLTAGGYHEWSVPGLGHFADLALVNLRRPRPGPGRRFRL